MILRTGSPLMVAGLLAVCPAPAQACSVEFDGGQKVESIRYVLAFRTQPARLAVGSQFAVELPSVPRRPRRRRACALRLHAGSSPRHELRPSVKPPPMDARCEGSQFHMPGRWDFISKCAAAADRRLTRGIVLE